MIWERYGPDRKHTGPMTYHEWLDIPPVVRRSLLKKGIMQEKIKKLVVGAGAFGEPYIKRVELIGEDEL